MTHIILAILAIALTVLLISTTVMHLGEASSNKGALAESMKKTNEGQQIAAAITIYKNDGNFIDHTFKLEDLKDKYITSIPKEGWSAEPYYIFSPTTVNACIEANTKANYIFQPTDSDIYIGEENPDFPIPYCSKEGLSKNIPCCYTPDS